MYIPHPQENPHIANAYLEIDLAAYRSNIAYIRSLVGVSVNIMQVVKADAYGHGAYNIAHVAEQCGVSYIGVATVAEGYSLRQQGIHLPILVLGAFFVEHIPYVVEAGLEVMITSREHAKVLRDYVQQTSCELAVHIKIDSGMGRLGILPKEVDELLDVLETEPKLCLVGICTHFAESESPDQEFTHTQMSSFRSCLSTFHQRGYTQLVTHMANSGATLSYPSTHADMVRVGIATYGLADHEDAHLKPILSLVTRISTIKTVEQGKPIGYGRSYVTSKDSRIATIPLGYADGVPRRLSNQQDVLIGGARCPIVGRISMDQCTVDVTGLSHVGIGDEVVLIGGQGNEYIGVREWAQKMNTIAYDILCGFGNRLPRVMKS